MSRRPGTGALRRSGIRSLGGGGGGGAAGFTYSAAESAVQLPLSSVGLIVSDVAGAGLTIGGGTSLDGWTSTHGGKAGNVALTPLLVGTNSPVYQPTGGVGGRPQGVWDGVNDNLRTTAFTAWGLTPLAWQIDIWGYLAGAETANDLLARLTLTDNINFMVDATPRLRGTVSGTGGATITSLTTTVTGSFRRMTYRGFGGASGLQELLVNGSIEQSGAITHAAWTDAGALSIGAAASGGTPTALTCMGWALTLGASAANAVTADQNTYLAGLAAFHLGIT